MIKKIEKELEMNFFSSLSLAELQEDFDEKLADDVEQEFITRVKSTSDFKKKKKMIETITDRLRDKMMPKVKMQAFKETNWKGYQAKNMEQDFQKIKFNPQTDTDKDDEGDSKENSEEFEDETEDGHYYGIENELDQETRERINDAKQRKGRGILVTLNEHNEHMRVEKLVRAMKFGLSVALVCDAGTPTIADPGFQIVNESAMNGI